ncbi:hypothetical protein DACRYDRAFT_107137 [Dacryopinax primogenitus]|uniref:Uncharacterized protein n=1 Tax=Dacryopinax primogenitus (strain DJM 731) TaxID=1858805 RepID=M5FWC5_DACPD|nr:uncharacterized protein DACRYDRAFT_107137 [Dacryopinax primogenitus]EJU02201.1 hypothetical protein DACRYDRAFT_107137 [Dacryopinax primogenitus]
MESRLKPTHPRDEDGNVDHPHSKRLRGALNPERETQVKEWMRRHRAWVNFVQQLNEKEEGVQKAEMEQNCVDKLLISVTEQEESLPALQQIGLEVVKAGQRDLAVLAIELGKLYDAAHPREIAGSYQQSIMDVASVEAQEEATVKAWISEYVGDTVNLFHDHFKGSAPQSVGGPALYSKSFVIANSSGMGKTRMIDESSKTLFTVLFVLRDTTDGFPPPDAGVLA